MAGAQCCANPPAVTLASGSEVIGGLDAYVAGSERSTAAVLFVSDIYGYAAPNLRKLADKAAAAGYYVVVPDFFRGDPYVPEKYPSLQEWLKLHGPEEASVDARTVVASLKSKGISSVGALGVCWGAKVIVELAKTHDILAAVMFHPSLVTLDDIKEVKCHISILAAELDKITPPQLVKQFKEVLSEKSEIDSFVKIFPGVSHGWTIRYNADDKMAAKSAEEAHTDMLDWFNEHLK